MLTVPLVPAVPPAQAATAVLFRGAAAPLPVCLLLSSSHVSAALAARARPLPAVHAPLLAPASCTALAPWWLPIVLACSPVAMLYTLPLAVASGVGEPDPGPRKFHVVTHQTSPSWSSWSRRVAAFYETELLLPLRSPQTAAALSEGAPPGPVMRLVFEQLATTAVTDRARRGVGLYALKLLLPLRPSQKSTTLSMARAVTSTAWSTAAPS